MFLSSLFDFWSEKKKIIHQKEKKLLYFKEGEILWVHLGMNVEDEEYGKGEKFLRPVLVVKKFNAHLFLGIPLSSVTKDTQYYFEIHIRKNNKKDVSSSALLSQIRVFDAKRLQNSFGTISPQELLQIKEKAKEVLLS